MLLVNTKSRIHQAEMSASTDLNLLHSWSLEPQIEAVIAQASNLRMAFVITDADNWNSRSFDQLY